ncbi:MAG: RlmE family RNA methyltransferase [Candidatus Adiutrix sp.]|jgi:23S rRNA (uridine2552-2'-O)-methyltransferase|nr:RlmE family RNA methyltransferase [Candidatus Adiutrix sp.]
MTIKDRSRLDDHYSRKARQSGYPARSVFKLEEMDRKYLLFRPSQRILDLGCAPGGWSLYAAQKVGRNGLVIGLDLKPPALKNEPNLFFLAADLLAVSPELVKPKGPFDLVLSDLAPATSGRKEVDQARSLALVQTAWAWAEILLKPGGHFIYKIFQSPEGEAFSRNLKEKFNKIELLKPRATRERSREIFGLGIGFKPEDE